jgi:biopolymer transport protein ExbD
MPIPRRTFKVEVPSVAMGDIAFNLLVFFVILARAQDDSHLKWEAAITPKVEAVKQSKVSVVVDINNKLYLNGRETDQQRLAKGIEEQLGNLPAGQRVVLLKINKQAQALRFEPILEAVSEAGGEIVHILDEKKDL